MRIHDLKVWPAPFEDTVAGRKPYEVRKDDRDYRVGDVLLLREWDPMQEAPGEAIGYTGRAALAVILTVSRGPLDFGQGQLLPAGVAVLGLEVQSELLTFIPPNRAA